MICFFQTFFLGLGACETSCKMAVLESAKTKIRHEQPINQSITSFSQYISAGFDKGVFRPLHLHEFLLDTPNFNFFGKVVIFLVSEDLVTRTMHAKTAQTSWLKLVSNGFPHPVAPPMELNYHKMPRRLSAIDIARSNTIKMTVPGVEDRNEIAVHRPPPPIPHKARSRGTLPSRKRPAKPGFRFQVLESKLKLVTSFVQNETGRCNWGLFFLGSPFQLAGSVHAAEYVPCTTWWCLTGLLTWKVPDKLLNLWRTSVNGGIPSTPKVTLRNEEDKVLPLRCCM